MNAESIPELVKETAERSPNQQEETTAPTTLQHVTEAAIQNTKPENKHIATHSPD